MDAPDLPAGGRPRNEAVRRRILEAAYDLVVARGYASVTTAEIAAKAGAGKQTIYRWWSTKPALVLDALDHRVQAGDAAGSLPALLAQACRDATLAGPVLRALMAEAQFDAAVRAEVLTRLVAPRREALRTQLAGIGLPSGRPREALVSAVDGALWSRLLLDEPLDETFVDAMVCLAEGAAETATETDRPAGR